MVRITLADGTTELYAADSWQLKTADHEHPAVPITMMRFCPARHRYCPVNQLCTGLAHLPTSTEP